jgi:hypothetical protein
MGISCSSNNPNDLPDEEPISIADSNNESDEMIAEPNPT